MGKSELRRLEILDECLSQIQSGERSLSECLHAYPDHAEYLKSHLLLAMQTRDLLKPTWPSEEFVGQTKTRVLNRIRVKRPSPIISAARKFGRPSWLTRPVIAYITLVVVVVLLASGLGVAGASASALPGDPLYKIKLGIEDTRLALTQDPASDAELLLLFANTRLEEVIALTEASREEDIGLALAGYDQLIDQLLDLVDEGKIDEETDTLDKVHFGLLHHQDILQEVLDNAPESAQEGLENAMDRSSHGKDVIEQIQGGGSPSDLAPGQQDKEKDEIQEQENQGNPPSDRGGGTGSDRTPGRPPTKTPKPPKE